MAFTLDRIGWEDEPSTKTPIDSGNLKKLEDNTEKFVENKVDGVEVYSNSAGTTSSFTLSQPLNDVNKIRVHYKGKNTAFENEICEIKEIPVVNGIVDSSLAAYYCGSTNLWIMRASITISGKAAILSNNFVNIIGEEISINNTASIFVTKVEIL